MEKKHKALKRFGQNYLIDRNIVNKIINEFCPNHEDTIIEIGPGLGILTEQLVNSQAKVIGVEIDNRVIENLRERFPSLELINMDILDIDLVDIKNKFPQKLRVIGNIPYNITSPILFKLIENRSFIEDAMFMVQYEVAKRIVSPKGNKDYGILSVILNFFAEVELCFKVPPTVFRPAPKVDSAIISLKLKDFRENFDDKLFINVVKSAFGNRRKSLKNSFGNSIFSAYNLSGSSIDLTKRAEQLGIEDFIQLTRYIDKKANE